MLDLRQKTVMSETEIQKYVPADLQEASDQRHLGLAVPQVLDLLDADEGATQGAAGAEHFAL